MLILVPIKRVVDPYAVVRPLPDGSGMDTAGQKFDINPFDEIALEEAVRLKEAGSADRIVAVSWGGSECEDQLRKALAMGADEALLFEAEDLDPSVIAAELQALVAELQPGLILMGKQDTDTDHGQTPPMLAALTGLPLASYAARITISGGSAEVVRETDSGEETVTVPLPAIISADLRLNEPRYIALPGIIKARSKPLTRRDRLTTAAGRTRVVAYAPPPDREPGRRVASVEELAEAIQAKGVLA
ncbi:MAG: electron transfer flavoprotein subunit beta/FixA family protein [Fimbriimonadaceae bacterium]|nr:electron transfer flavoprotein subunit beta/FixA family protein [Fimbriimonadaceae bacterium]